MNGSERQTTYVSATELKAQLTAADVASGGGLDITVVTPPLGVGTSNTKVLTVVGPSLSCASPADRKGPVELMFSNGPGGTGEWVGLYPAAGGSYVDWQWIAGGRTDRSTATTGTLVFPTAGVSLSEGEYRFKWQRSGTIIAECGPVTLLDVVPQPAVSGLYPADVVAGSPGFTLHVSGSGFVPT
ncbi:MAG: hypothetical protein KDI74_19085, partial [Gammaproteobacteria bacterium]|nr:hypothetical protein [Gammaproteobacteria bacterium]